MIVNQKVVTFSRFHLLAVKPKLLSFLKL